MSSRSRLKSVTRFVRVAAVLGAVGYAAWTYWQQQNRADAAVWASGTDRVD